MSEVTPQQPQVPPKISEPDWLAYVAVLAMRGQGYEVHWIGNKVLCLIRWADGAHHHVLFEVRPGDHHDPAADPGSPAP
jgi:hypothetical protein